MTSSRAQSGLLPIHCEVCGQEFAPYRAWQVTCSRPCRDRLPPRELPWTKLRHFVCTICFSPFEKVVTNGVHKYCDACAERAAKQAAERKNMARNARWKTDPEWREKQRAIQLHKTYGISVERYDEMHAQQGGCCAICGKPPKPDGNRAASRLVVDHDHDTGQVRRLLCNNCNRALGYFGDDVATLASALHYLTLWKGRPKD